MSMFMHRCQCELDILTLIMIVHIALYGVEPFLLEGGLYELWVGKQ